MNKVQDESNDKNYFTLTPRIVWAKCSDPYEFTLWSVIKGIAGDDGECYLSTPDLAKLSMMSSGKVSQCRKSLINKGLLEGDLRRDPGYPQPVWHLSIPDLWPENIASSLAMPSLRERIDFKARQKEPSPGERGITPGETKKIHKKIHKENFTPSSGENPPQEPEPDLATELFGPFQENDPPKSDDPAYLDRLCDAAKGDPVAGAAFIAQTASKASWTVPEVAGGADPWERVADAFCCLQGLRLSDMPPKRQIQWSRKLSHIGEEALATPEQVIAAIRALPDTGLAFKVPGYTTPYKQSFEDDIAMVIAKITTGQIIIKGVTPSGPSALAVAGYDMDALNAEARRMAADD